ncbi:hypothetical protein EHS86_05840 [Erwinia amylovora]|uniref:Uncharacterized protein n=2 Tax=Erwinia amylovora TaxID=552 RepID=D4I3S3_ERWAC|nr:hypothetical protein AD997_17135 [Erwinia amylovora]CBA23906.1 hypothetical protein predicted by Glimmer/Critica [Erwinia amylovora CFBP1430]CCO87992.1 hypothetical protein BN434_3634 [Erwinia amylovora CFBP 2585]QJQ56214.1 hypothetical protein EHX00_3515 [Erwinia amylovora]QJQ59913.1 hypothetical protein EHW99_3515 [Erwinia amylovora]
MLADVRGGDILGRVIFCRHSRDFRGGQRVREMLCRGKYGYQVLTVLPGPVGDERYLFRVSGSLSSELMRVSVNSSSGNDNNDSLSAGERMWLRGISFPL